ncbi:hypothetical protein CYLTODRAFT_360210 [Cylindrobasidium torrendii FP15055 ss-10]|uniref:MYND-type domain-containing protein n=1 Tax=Cylindrobasidium torrendii FP15055 ss-10 TaxID=1314674 RepID=A0A0D7AYK9_9AGAR|nr:hypothetical protein CYLTODRAFT_360210 [Cylindrobasidium torrendii FP15055 ss-10]
MAQQAASGTGTEVALTIIIYGSSSRDPGNFEERFAGSGWEQRRLELQLRPRIPAHATASMDAKNKWMHDFLMSIGPDAKHSRNWRCEFCRKFARETVWQMASWLHLPQPMFTAYVHNMCDAKVGDCADALEEVDNMMAAQQGAPKSNVRRRMADRSADDPQYPMSATCAVCNNEDVASRKNLMQCGKCKVVRYCSGQCQKDDWKRHKTFCKTVTDVKWVWNK